MILSKFQKACLACTIVITSILIVFAYLHSSSTSVYTDTTNNEEYIWVSTMTGDSMFTKNDIPAFHLFGKEKNVTTTIMGPKDYDIVGQIAALEEAIEKKPAGILVLGMEPSLASTINKAIQKGIPVITVDSDVKDSNRIAFVGSDWYDIGVKQAEAMVRLIGGKGQIALLGIGGADTTESAFDGYKSVIENYPDITIVGEYDDMANSNEAQRITTSVLNTYPNVVGFSGFDSNSGKGIAAGIHEANSPHDIKVTAMDTEPNNLKLLSNKEIDLLIGQKRALFTYYGGMYLYNLKHSKLRIQALDKDLTPIIPEKTYTGIIEINSSNLYTYYPDYKQ